MWYDLEGLREKEPPLYPLLEDKEGSMALYGGLLGWHMLGVKDAGVEFCRIGKCNHPFIPSLKIRRGVWCIRQAARNNGRVKTCVYLHLVLT